MEIETQLHDLSSVKKKLSVAIPADVATEEFRKVAGDFKRYARLPGFRAGKAPLQLVKKRFAGDIRGEVVKKLVPEAYEKAIKGVSLAPISEPSIENLHAEEGESITFDATFEVAPKIELPEYRGLKVEVEPQEVDEQEVERQLESLREQNAQLVAVDDRPVQEGDQVMIDLRGEFLGDPEEESGAPVAEEDVIVHVGDEGTHPEFSRNLQGMNIGEEKTFEADYDKDYPAENLAGKKLKFTVEVTNIKKKELPELNDEFAKDLGEFESLEEIKERIRGDLRDKQTQERESTIRELLLNQLIAKTSFEVPEVLVESRARERLERMAGNIAAQGIDPSRANINWRKVREEMHQRVVDEVRGNLILEEIGLQEGFEASQEELDAEIKGMAEAYNQPEEKVRQYFLQDGGMEDLKGDLRRRKAMAVVRESAEIKESAAAKKAEKTVTEPEPAGESSEAEEPQKAAEGAQAEGAQIKEK